MNLLANESTMKASGRMITVIYTERSGDENHKSERAFRSGLRVQDRLMLQYEA